MRGLNSLSPVFLCVAKMGLLLDNRILIRQILPLCDCDEHKMCIRDRIEVMQRWLNKNIGDKEMERNAR